MTGRANTVRAAGHAATPSPVSAIRNSRRPEDCTLVLEESLRMVMLLSASILAELMGGGVPNCRNVQRSTRCRSTHQARANRTAAPTIAPIQMALTDGGGPPRMFAT